MSDIGRIPTVPHGRLSVLSASEAEVTVTTLDTLVGHWTRRDMFPIDFYTLGAASYLDAVADIESYRALALEKNPLLATHFGALYQAVRRQFAPLLGPCVLHDALAHPGFHIFGHRPGQANNRFTIRAMEALTGSIHSDRQFEPHTAVWSTFHDVDLEHTLTFTLALELPSGGGGLCFWDDPSMARYDDDGAFSMHVKNAIDFEGLHGVPRPTIIPYRVGELFFFFGQGSHVIAPSLRLSPTDRRITLQGHGTLCDGTWRLYF
jgi:hypothetical protein